MGRKALDLKGKAFGLLTVVERIYKDSTNDSHWKCNCECGNVCEVTGSNLKSGRTVSCGCENDRKRKQYNDLTSQKFGKLTVLEISEKQVNHKIYWKCLCECGNTCDVSVGRLTSGKTQSCGCLRVEKLIKDCVEETRLNNLKMKRRKRINKDSGVKGVIWDPSRKKWKACIKFKGKGITLGRFDDVEDAAKIRDEAEKKLFGNFLKWYNDKYGTVKAR